MTREFAQTLEGKTPHPYLRTEQDSVQEFIARAAADGDNAENSVGAYLRRMIHFWREVSVAGLPRAGRGADELFALLFESAFELATQDPSWAGDALPVSNRAAIAKALTYLADRVHSSEISHEALVRAFQAINAPSRENLAAWNTPSHVIETSELWFWAAVSLAAEVSSAHPLGRFRAAVAASAAEHWSDQRLHTELIRRAPRVAEITPRSELMEHALLRIARLKYAEGGAEQSAVLQFLNQRAILEGFESETDSFNDGLTLARWVRDARRWATVTLDAEPEIWRDIRAECGDGVVTPVTNLFRRLLGAKPATVDSLDTTEALIGWAQKLRGFKFSDNRAQELEFIAVVVDAALWLGWLFPEKSARVRNKRRPAENE